MNAPISAKSESESESESVSASAGDKDGAEALALIREEAEQVTDAEVVQANWDIDKAVQTALLSAGRIRSFAGGIAMLPGFEMKSVDALELYALGCLEAHRLAQREDGVEQAMLDRAKQVRDHLQLAAELSVVAGTADAKRVASIRASGRSYVALAKALHELGGMGRELGGVGVTDEQLEEANSLAKAIVRMLSERGVDGPKQVRLRAWTLLVRHYDQCRRALTYLRWKEGDVDAIAPSLFKRPRRRRSRAGDTASVVTESAVIATEGASKDAKLESAS